MPTSKTKRASRPTPKPRSLEQQVLKAIFAAVRGDEKSECWTIRKLLDAYGIFNDDISGRVRLIELACKLALNQSPRKGP